MKLVLLHPLPFDGSIWPPSTRSLSDECFAPTLYEFGDDIVDWTRRVLDLVGSGPMVVDESPQDHYNEVRIARSNRLVTTRRLRILERSTP